MHFSKVVNMEIEMLNAGQTQIAWLRTLEMEVLSVEDVLDLLMNARYQGALGLILSEANLSPDFFELESGMAGEILQKFSTYDMRLAIVGDFNKVSRRSLRDFIYESNKIGRINFVGSLDEAIDALS